MPTYEFEYTNNKREKVRFEERYKMSEVPSFVDVVVDGITYRAHRIISLTARMATNWDSYEPSDLPPINHPIQ